MASKGVGKFWNEMQYFEKREFKNGYLMCETTGQIFKILNFPQHLALVPRPSIQVNLQCYWLRLSLGSRI
jgi:hypothetical protein